MRERGSEREGGERERGRERERERERERGGRKQEVRTLHQIHCAILLHLHVWVLVTGPYSKFIQYKQQQIYIYTLYIPYIIIAKPCSIIQKLW